VGRIEVWCHAQEVVFSRGTRGFNRRHHWAGGVGHLELEVCASPDRWGIVQFLGESHDGNAASVLQECFVSSHHVDVVLRGSCLGVSGGNEVKVRRQEEVF